MILISFRLVRGWNQTGQKFAGEPDLVKISLIPQPRLLWCLVLGTYATVGLELVSRTKALPSFISKPVIVGLMVSAISFKLAFTKEDAPEIVTGFVRGLQTMLEGPSLLARARALFLGLVLALVYPVFLLAADRGRSSYHGRHKSCNIANTSSLILCTAVQIIHHIYTLLALTQSRATNIPLFLLFRILQAYLERLNLNVAEITTSSLLLQFASFFAMGGTNAISSVDLSNAYNGVSDFNMVAVGVLTFISNWAAPVWWTSATTLRLLQYKRACGRSPFQSHIALLTLFVATSLGFVMAACAALRTHLFIWTVFSPKYLYSMGWSIGQHLGVNIGAGGLLYWLGSRGLYTRAEPTN